MYLLIPYDITDDKRRRQVEKVLSFYGRRVNYSVFEVEVGKVDYVELLHRLEKESDAKADHIRIYHLDRTSLSKSFVLHSKAAIFEYETLYV